MITYEMSISEVVDDMLSDEFGGWTYEGAKVIAEMLDEVDGKYNRIEVRCNFSEYSFDEFKDAYPAYTKEIKTAEDFVVIFNDEFTGAVFKTSDDETRFIVSH